MPARGEGKARTASPTLSRKRIFSASLFRFPERGRQSAGDGRQWRRPLLLFLLAASLGASPGQAQSPVGEVFASDASIKGSMVLAAGGMEVMSGSTVAAGAETALLKLSRGGEVRVCARTQLSLGTSASGRDLMLALNSGALEASYGLGASADAVMTPDFRILVAGPGTVHFALGVDPRGDTCVRSLASNTTSLLVSELLGDGAYQVKPNEQVVFREGRVTTADHALADCGCPAPPATLQAAPAPGSSPRVPQEAPTPAPPAQEVHVQVEAPFVFRASDPEPSMQERVAQLRLQPAPQWPDFLVSPPPVAEAAAPTVQAEATSRPKPRIFGRLRAFFAAIFR